MYLVLVFCILYFCYWYSGGSKFTYFFANGHSFMHYNVVSDLAVTVVIIIQCHVILNSFGYKLISYSVHIIFMLITSFHNLKSLQYNIVINC